MFKNKKKVIFRTKHTQSLFNEVLLHSHATTCKEYDFINILLIKRSINNKHNYMSNSPNILTRRLFLCPIKNSIKSRVHTLHLLRD